MHDSFPAHIKILEEKTLFMDGANRLCYLIACDMCKNSTYHPRYAILKSIKRGWHYFFCSQKCAKLFNKKSQIVECEMCGKQVEKHLNQIKKTKHHFCSRSCAATYSNSHKTHGTRRSKLEIFIEDKIKNTYKHTCSFNDVKTIGSELDIYFPGLRLAIQINGPLHYKPIYGQKRFARTVELDAIKRVSCKDLGIQLVEIDVSKDINTNSNTIKELRWKEISSIISAFTETPSF